MVRNRYEPMIDDKWDCRFLEMAKLVASWSKDPSTRVGAVLVRPDKTIASTGFNGYAQKMHDLGLDNREEKYSRIIHAEMNALHFCKEDMTGYTLYVWPMMCCDRCSVHVIQAGITRVVSTDYNNDGRWSESILKALQYFRSCGVEAQLYPEKEISDQPVSPSPRLVHQPVYCPLCNSL
ncbi:MAG: hypothetical protein GY774_13200 [Planctomycetes bacterium]|nr:hypothetical protein [Planctomycetota bacterium]